LAVLYHDGEVKERRNLLVPGSPIIGQEEKTTTEFKKKTTKSHDVARRKEKIEERRDKLCVLRG
jgi:hypothetical protein